MIHADRVCPLSISRCCGTGTPSTPVRVQKTALVRRLAHATTDRLHHHPLACHLPWHVRRLLHRRDLPGHDARIPAAALQGLRPVPGPAVSATDGSCGVVCARAGGGLLSETS